VPDELTAMVQKMMQSVNAPQPPAAVPGA